MMKLILVFVMLKNVTLPVGLTVALSACIMIQHDYIPSSPTNLTPNNLTSKNKSELLVFYNPKDVSFEYIELSRIFLNNMNYGALRSPGQQINRILDVAAENGAAAVIIIEGKSKEVSGAVFGNFGGMEGGDVYRYPGVAILKKKRVN